MNEASTSPQISSASNDQASMGSTHDTNSFVLGNSVGAGGMDRSTPVSNIEEAQSAAAGAAAAAAAATDKKQALQVPHSVKAEAPLEHSGETYSPRGTESTSETGFSPELLLALSRGAIRKPLTESEQQRRTDQIRICTGDFLDAAEQEHLKTMYDAWVIANGSSKSTRKGERALRINCSRTTSFSHRCYSYLLVLLL
jgi:hypothetical protein